MDNSDLSKPPTNSTAVRKRRSSILKAGRAPRTPFSELEFNVATPTETTKSRRVSFSCRTGVAEFVTNEATTTWKNFYEEHNKSLELSGNESAVKQHQVIGHIGKRVFDDQFTEFEAEIDIDPSLGKPRNRSINHSQHNPNFTQQLADLDRTRDDKKLTAPDQKFELSTVTGDSSKLFADDLTNPGFVENSDKLNIDFSVVQPVLDKKDDLDDILFDLQRASTSHNNLVCAGPSRDRKDVSQYIEVELNMTRGGLINEESDMSITDTINNPKVQEISKSNSINVEKKVNSTQEKDWIADKENIVFNPYSAPKETENFAVNASEEVLVFDGKKLKIVTETSSIVNENEFRKTLLPDSIKVPQRKTIVLNTDDDLPNFVDDKQAGLKNTIIYEDSDLSLTQTLESGVNEIKPVANMSSKNNTKRRNTTVYDDATVDISITQALPTNIVSEIYPVSRRKTIVYEDEAGNMSVTQALPTHIVFQEKPCYVETRKSVKYDEDNFNVSITQVLPTNIISNSDIAEKRKTVIYETNEGDISMTQALPGNILSQDRDANTEKRKTILFSDSINNISITQSIPANIISEKRKTILFEDGSADVSMTQAIPTNVILEDEGVKCNKRNTLVFEGNDMNISVTQAIPANVILNNNDSKKLAVDLDYSTQKMPINEISEEPKTIMFEDDSADVSVTRAITTNFILEDRTIKSDKRNTLVFEGNDMNISVTQAIPINVILNAIDSKSHAMDFEDDSQKIRVNKVSDKRKTLMFADDSADISVTQAIPSNVILEDGSVKSNVFEGNNMNISVTENKAKDNTISQPVTNNEVSGEMKLSGNHNSYLNIEMLKRRSVACSNADIYTDINNVLLLKNDVTCVKEKSMGYENIIDKNKTRGDSIILHQSFGLDTGKANIVEDRNVSVKEVLPADILLIKSDMCKNSMTNESDSGNVSMNEILSSKVNTKIETENSKLDVYESETSYLMTKPIPSALFVQESDISIVERSGINEISYPKIYSSENTNVSEPSRISITQGVLSYSNDQLNNSCKAEAIVSNILNNSLANLTKFEKEKNINQAVDMSITQHINSSVSEICKDFEPKMTDAADVMNEKTHKGVNQDKIVFSISITEQKVEESHENNRFEKSFPNKDSSYVYNENTVNEEIKDRKSMLYESICKSIAKPLPTTLRSVDQDLFEKWIDKREYSLNNLSQKVTSNIVNNEVIVFQTSMTHNIAKADAQLYELTSSETNTIDSSSYTISKQDENVKLEENYKDLCAESQAKIKQERKSIIKNDDRSEESLLLEGDVSMESVEEENKEKDKDYIETVMLPFKEIEPVHVQIKKHSVHAELPGRSILNDLLDMSDASMSSYTANESINKKKEFTNSHEKMFIITDDDDEIPSDPNRHNPIIMNIRLKSPSKYNDNCNVKKKENGNQPMESSMLAVDDPKPADQSPEHTDDSPKLVKTSPNKEIYNRHYEKISLDAERSFACSLQDKSSEEADNTQDLLEMLSNLTDKDATLEERLPAPGTSQGRSIVSGVSRRSTLSRQELLNNISMAQAMLQKSRLELDDTSLQNLTATTVADSPAPPKCVRMSGTESVVKTLNFDNEESPDEEASYRKSTLRKSSSGEPSGVLATKAKVIPKFLRDHVTDEIKDLMDELVKPNAEALPCGPQPSHPQSSRRCRGTQATFDASSQLDLFPHPVPPESHVLPRRFSIGAQACPGPHRNRSPPADPILMFDESNPLNNVLLAPTYLANAPVPARRFSPSLPDESPSVSMRSNSAQIVITLVEQANQAGTGLLTERESVFLTSATSSSHQMDEDDPMDGAPHSQAQSKTKKRIYSPARSLSTLNGEITPKPSSKMAKLSSKIAEILTSPNASEPLSTSPKDSDHISISPKGSDRLSMSSKGSSDRLSTSLKYSNRLPTFPKDSDSLSTSPKGSDRLSTSPKDSDRLSASPKDSDRLSTSPKDYDRLSTSPKDSDRLSTSPKDSDRLSTPPKDSDRLSTSPKDSDRLSTSPKDSDRLSTSPKDSDRLSTSPKPSEHLSTSPKDYDHISSSPKGSDHLYTSPKDSDRLSTSPKDSDHISTSPKGFHRLSWSPKDPDRLSTSPKGSSDHISTSPKDSNRLSTSPKGSDRLSTSPKGSDRLFTSPKGSDRLYASTKGSDFLSTSPKASDCLSTSSQIFECLSVSPKDSDLLSTSPKAYESLSTSPKVSECLSLSPKAPECYSTSPKATGHHSMLSKTFKRLSKHRSPKKTTILEKSDEKSDDDVEMPSVQKPKAKKKSKPKKKGKKFSPRDTTLTVHHLAAEYHLAPDRKFNVNDRDLSVNNRDVSDNDRDMQRPIVTSKLDLTSLSLGREGGDRCSMTTVDSNTSQDTREFHTDATDCESFDKLVATDRAALLATLRALPCMGTPECVWETGERQPAWDEWSWLLLRSRLRLIARFGDKDSVKLNVETCSDIENPVAVLCVKFAELGIRRVLVTCERAQQLAGALRRSAAVARLALRWGRATQRARTQLACRVHGDRLCFTTANVALRTVWETSMTLVWDEEGGIPRATDVTVTRLVGDADVTSRELSRVLCDVRNDWGHVDDTVWRVFRYMKHKAADDDLLFGPSV